MPSTAEEIGLSFAILSLVFAGASLIRRLSRPLRALFIPTAVIGGFLMLALGPEGLGRWTGGYGLFSDTTFAVWKVLPGLLINVMCATLLLGERLPPLKTIWKLSGSHVIMAGIMSAGQFAVGSILALLVLGPVFGFTDKSGALIEMAFAGGHGTLAGLTPVLVAYGAEDLLEVGLGLATIGMVTGIIIGTMLVNYAVNSPTISVARHERTSDKEDLDIDHHLHKADDEPMDEWNGMTQVTAAAVFIGVSIVTGIVLHEIFRRVFHLIGSDFFDKFPLFPFTIIGGVLVQLAAVPLQVRVGRQPSSRRGTGRSLGRRHRGLCNRHVVTQCTGRSPGAARDPGGGSVGWSVFVAMVIGPRVFPTNWFEHSLAEFGESQGNVATGFVMVDMVDPARQTDVVSGYSYRQLVTRPILGGGFVTAMSVPLISNIGLPAFMAGAVMILIAMTVWGIRHARVSGVSGSGFATIPRHARG
jgi:ESS family glutamate:Na+ symporter